MPLSQVTTFQNIAPASAPTPSGGHLILVVEAIQKIEGERDDDVDLKLRSCR
jgi:hypothetical protein